MYCEHRVPVGDRQELIVGRLGVDPVKEDSDFDAPATEVGPKHGWLLVAFEFSAGECLGVPTEPELTGACGSEIADPVGLASGGDQVGGVANSKQVHGGGVPSPRPVALYP